ncbi:hypothetical protein [Amycolatopsis sp. CA-128772]|uniref:hypothetical protein n=1 Tax=Amycolatopsis sp. CA-128772 TaxID=2073159 RepID=UPI0011B0BCD2|nr:hypothetical protein [Amycolatopsis sp. CA-128772]
MNDVDAKQLFIHTLQDLEERTQSTDEYTILMSAALLRKLLFDELRLIDQVNRTHKLKIRFRINGVSPIEQFNYDNPPVFYIIEDAFDPDSPFTFSPYDATLDQFANRRIMYSNANWITVRDAVNYFANIAGAVHHGPAKNVRQHALDAAAAFYGHQELPGALHQMKLIGRLTIEGLDPLRKAVLTSGEAT